MDEFTYYEGPEYLPPTVVLAIGSMLRGPRGHYTTNFADLFSSDTELQHSYVDGLLVIGVFFLVVLVVWSLILIVLKLKGNEVGCASGQAFQAEIKIAGDDRDLQSTDSSESCSSIGADSESEADNAPGRHIAKHTLDDGSANNNFDHHYEEADDDYASREEWLYKNDGAPSRKKISQREKRTRICFLFFSLVSLVCVPLILVFSFGPIKEATRTSDDILLAARDALDQVSASLNAIDSAARSAVEIADATPTDIRTICPQIDSRNIESELGIELNDLVDTVSDNFDELNGVVNYQLRAVKTVVAKMETGMMSFENSMDEVDTWIWIVPGLLLAVSLITSLSMFGVLLAWKEKSGKRLQRAMSYVVLPSLIVASIACWVIVMCASFGTMVSSDMCTSGTRYGSPDETIQQILSNHGLNHNDTVFKLVNAYTNRCMGSDPTADVIDLEKMVQDSIDIIWRQISKVDSIGRAKLIEQCGGEEFIDLISGSRNLAKLLTVMRKALGSASGSLECGRINPLYTQAAHDSVCTDSAAAAAYGFIMFLILAISTMTMISLRASWLRNTEEEKVYHDESEVAENMILDEHEEYLNYISRYKHEWQEYRGFDNKSVAQSEDSYGEEQSEGTIYFEDEVGEGGSRTDGEGYNGSEEFSDDGSDITPAGLKVELFPSSKHAPFIDDGASYASDDISFPSLNGHQSDDNESIGEEDLFKLPSPLLPPASNPEYEEDPDESLLPTSTGPPKASRSSGSTNRGEAISSFFDRYGINPRQQKKDVAHVSRQRDAPGDAPGDIPGDAPEDAPGDAPGDHASRPSEGGDDIIMTERRKVNGDELSRRQSPTGGEMARSYTTDAPPPIRTIFQANSTGDIDEVEVQLSPSTYEC